MLVVDPSKDFDTICYNILQTLGIKGSRKSFRIKSYLSDRKQYMSTLNTCIAVVNTYMYIYITDL